MAEIFKFFNSAPGDERWHYASDFADYFGSVLSSGLISNGNSPVGLQVTVNTGTMTTSVNVGRALIKGYSYENTTPLTLTHSTPEQTLDRIDRIVLRLDLKNTSRFIKVFVKEGVSALEPIPPTLQRDQYIYELSLAQVRIRKNTSSIVVSDIKDERADENLCGIVQSLITVPTSVFQQQFDAWFNSQKDIYESNIIEWQNQEKVDFESWVNSMHDILDENTAGNLLSIINDHKADLVSHGVYGIVTGTNTLTMTIGNVNAYVEGMLVAFKNTTANTGATTLNINNLGAKSIKKANGSALSSGNLKAGGVYQVRYDGSSFILLGEGGEYGTAGALQVLSGYTIGTENGIINGSMVNRGMFNLPMGASVPAGYYSGGTVPSGGYYTYGTATSVRGADNNWQYSATGIGFKPKILLVFMTGQGAETLYRSIVYLESEDPNNYCIINAGSFSNEPKTNTVPSNGNDPYVANGSFRFNSYNSTNMFRTSSGMAAQVNYIAVG